MDAYYGYHQIKMAVKDQEKTAFTTPFGAFCYVSMPFGLKSAQATYLVAVPYLAVLHAIPDWTVPYLAYMT